MSKGRWPILVWLVSFIGPLEMGVDEDSFLFVIQGVSIIISTDNTAKFLGILHMVGAYPAQQLAIWTNCEDAIEDKAPADDGPMHDEVHLLIHDDSAPPYNSSKVIKQVDFRAFHHMLNLIASHNIDPRKEKANFDIEQA